MDWSPNPTTCLILGPIQPTTPNHIHIWSAVLPQRTGQIDRQTHTHTCTQTKRWLEGMFDDYRPLLLYRERWRGLIIKEINTNHKSSEHRCNGNNEREQRRQSVDQNTTRTGTSYRNTLLYTVNDMQQHGHQPTLLIKILNSQHRQLEKSTQDYTSDAQTTADLTSTAPNCSAENFTLALSLACSNFYAPNIFYVHVTSATCTLQMLRVYDDCDHKWLTQ